MKFMNFSFLDKLIDHYYLYLPLLSLYVQLEILNYHKLFLNVFNPNYNMYSAVNDYS